MSRKPLPSFALVLLLAVPAFAVEPPIQLRVDAREAPRHVLHVIEQVPVHAGEVSLAFPKWLPGEHAPTGPIGEVAGLVVTAGGKRLEWRRDDVDMYVIRAHAPAGIDRLDLAFDFLLTDKTAGYSTASSATEELLVLNWNQVVFYPAGVPSDDVSVHASVTAPSGWSHGTPLERAGGATGALEFATCSLTRLVDSPVLMGAHFRTVDVSPPQGPRYVMDLACDGEAGLVIPDSVLAPYKRLPAEAQAWFGGWHHGPYHFLVTLSDYTAHFGLEHHDCSDDRTRERSFVDSDARLAFSSLLAHELSHSWNGKYRRPKGLATPDYGAPMKGELLWVYEGLTQYSGWLLDGRSGIRTRQQDLDDLARTTAQLENNRGREWRPLDDTAVEAQVLYDARDEWEFARRSVDFYDESTLIWLEADVKIRELTHGARSLDDFCHRFHGGQGPVEMRPYDRDEVIRTLNDVAPYDWAGFLHERVDLVQPHPPLGGIEAGGWKLAWSDTMSDIMSAREARDDKVDESNSIGIALDKEARIIDVVPGSAADKAGVAPGFSLVAVNGRKWSKSILRDAIRATRTGTPVELLVTNQDYFRTAKLAYTGGLRYPVLRRAPGRPDVISQILAPHAGH
jgi:predicted metalloprotease with PDZ domain